MSRKRQSLFGRCMAMFGNIFGQTRFENMSSSFPFPLCSHSSELIPANPNPLLQVKTYSDNNSQLWVSPFSVGSL
jgi:hypothetical protein